MENNVVRISGEPSHVNNTLDIGERQKISKTERAMKSPC